MSIHETAYQNAEPHYRKELEKQGYSETEIEGFLGLLESNLETMLAETGTRFSLYTNDNQAIVERAVQNADLTNPWEIASHITKEILDHGIDSKDQKLKDDVVSRGKENLDEYLNHEPNPHSTEGLPEAIFGQKPTITNDRLKEMKEEIEAAEAEKPTTQENPKAEVEEVQPEAPTPDPTQNLNGNLASLNEFYNGQPIVMRLDNTELLKDAFERSGKSEQFEALEGNYADITSQMATVPTITLTAASLEQAISHIPENQNGVEQSAALINGMLNRTEKRTSISVFDDFTTALDEVRGSKPVNLDEARVEKSVKKAELLEEIRNNEELKAQIADAVSTGGAGLDAADAVTHEPATQTENTEVEEPAANAEETKQKIAFKGAKTVTIGGIVVGILAGLGLTFGSSKKEQQVDPQTGQVQETKKPNWVKRIIGLAALGTAAYAGYQLSQGKTIGGASFVERENARRAQNNGKENGLG